MDAARSPNAHRLHIRLRDGFRGHTITIAVDGHEVYRGVGVVTGAAVAPPDPIDVPAASPIVHVEVSITPGDIAAALDLDVSAFPYLAIGLVGEGTVNFETAPHPFAST
jgi:hypothetical protein